MTVREAIFKGAESIVMESRRIRMEILPRGGRIASFLDRRTGSEFLVQQKSAVHRVGPYGSRMVDYEPAGFDDMFPTLDECCYTDYPWKGHLMPDHGELWSLAWEHELSADSVSLGVHGVRLPYHFEKTIGFSAENQVVVTYNVQNLSEFPLSFLWTAHPMLRVEEGTEFLLPPECTTAVCTLCFSGRLGSHGDEFSWPLLSGGIGAPIRLNRVRTLAAKNTEKYYFKNRLRGGWCVIRHPHYASLRLEFPPEKVPYFGVLVEEGGWANELYIIPEPCTSPFDRIDVATLHSRQTVLPPRGSYQWFLRMTLEGDGGHAG